MKSSQDRFDGASYEICIKGVLAAFRQVWFEGMYVESDIDGHTRLTGNLDQAALHGVLEKIRDLGITLVNVKRIENLSSSKDCDDNE